MCGSGLFTSSGRRLSHWDSVRTVVTPGVPLMLILGIGVGLFVLIIIWVLAFLACFVSAHCNKNGGLYAISLAATLTLILFLIPKEDYEDDTAKVYDSLFVWRIVLVFFLAIIGIATASVCLITHVTERRVVQRIKD